MANKQEEPIRISIHTMGRFVVFRDGHPLTWGRKLPRRPIALLKAIVAHGGRAVSSARLCELLWPDVEDPYARQSLKASLFRLRGLLGEGVVRTSNGAHFLDPERCWVDAWALQTVLDSLQIDQALSRDAKILSQRHVEAASLYQGDFLSEDQDLPFTEVLRDRLRERFLSALKSLADAYWAQDRKHEAAGAYLRAIDVNPLAEECYRGLMACYAEVGRRAEAMIVYERCRVALRKSLGLSPAARTQAVYRAIYHEQDIPPLEFLSPPIPARNQALHR